MAYARLGTVYSNLEEAALGFENAKKAFGLRERVTERERYYIDSHFYDLALKTGKKLQRCMSNGHKPIHTIKSLSAT